MKIEVTRRFERTLELLPPTAQNQVEDAIPVLAAAFGKPHSHMGLRKIGDRLYEFRVRAVEVVLKRWCKLRHRRPQSLFALCLRLR